MDLLTLCKASLEVARNELTAIPGLRTEIAAACGELKGDLLGRLEALRVPWQEAAVDVSLEHGCGS